MCVFHYLRKTADTRLTYHGDTGSRLLGYVDTDWANNVNDHRSILGHVFMLADTAVMTRLRWLVRWSVDNSRTQSAFNPRGSRLTVTEG